MTFNSFVTRLAYSYMPPAGVSLSRWWAMIVQWKDNRSQLSHTFGYFYSPSDESPSSWWDYEFAKASRRRGERRSFYQNISLTEI